MPVQTESWTNTDIETVLIVEDEDAIAELHEHALNDDYETRVAKNGIEAISEFDDDVDLVVLDRRLPEMNGDKVLQKLNQWETRFGVIIVSAVNPGKAIIEHPFDSYLTKTVDPADLREEIEYVKRKNELMSVLAEYLRTAETYETLDARTPTSDGEIELTLPELQRDLDSLETRGQELVSELDDNRVTDIFDVLRSNPRRDTQ